MAPRTETYAKKFKLVSGGYTNRKAWPDGMITVKPWDTEVDEWFVGTQEKGEGDLMQGILERVVGWNGATVDDVPVSEMLSILLMARSLSTGGVLHYTSDCAFCHNRELETIQVPEELEKVGEKAVDYPGYDLITLPVCKDVVAIRPLLVADERTISERKPEMRAAISDAMLRKLMPVVSVNEGRPDMIDELVLWYLALPPQDARFLVEQEEELSPQLNRRIPHKCSRCGREFWHVIKFDSDFFRSGSPGESGNSVAANVPAGVDGKGVPNQPGGGA